MSDIIPLWDNFTFFKHQRKAIRWMKLIEEEGVEHEKTTLYGGILADDMGLGKTLEIGGLLKNAPLPETLIICPVALIDNWYTNMSKCGFNVLILEDCWRLYDRKIKDPKQPSVYIMNYEKLLTASAEYVVERIWDRIVMDEAHKIRNPKSRITQLTYTIRGKYRWAVTGTPIVNSKDDIASLMCWIGLPGEQRFTKCMAYTVIKWTDSLQHLVTEIMMQRSMNDIRGIVKDAPPKPFITECIIPFESEEEEEFYRAIQLRIEDMKKKYEHDSSAVMIEMLMRLRQISVHPQVYINSRKKTLGPRYVRADWTAPVAKFEEVRRIIERENAHLSTENKHKYLFICHFKDEMELLSAFLKKHKLADEVLTYSGDLTKQKRDKVITAAKTTPNCALCLQLQAGGVGLNLQEFDRVIFLSPWWNSAIMEQAIARAVRVGQKKKVHVYHIKLEEEDTLNIDNFMHERVDMKKKMAVEVSDYLFD
jgi:SNF2 family DNA or RNA helicase